MTQSQVLTKFQLKKGLNYTICNPSEKCGGTQTSLGRTKDNYIVDLVVKRDPNGKRESATAYMPNQAKCISRGLPDAPVCQLDLLFKGKQLEQLISSSTDRRLNGSEINNNPTPPRPTPGVGNPPPHEHPQYIGTADLLLPALLAGLVGGAAFSAIQVLVTLLLKKKKDQNTSRVSHNQVSRDTGKRSDLPESDRIAREVQKQLFPARQKIQDLENKVSNLEIKLIEQYQKDQALNIKAPPISSMGPDILFAMKETATHLPPPPPPLSIDIIKQAVLDWSYQSIASYQFDFVTETIQSQKGEVDVKSFSIDGNQDQTDSRSQSEFIAINCQAASYLIPNILQNSADPARTISRHLDRIYKRGMGSELKNLAKLAIVRRTGDCYELVEMGQVA